MASADWTAASVDETSRAVHLPGARMAHVAPRVGQPWVGIAANRRSGIGRSRHRVERLVRALEERGLGCSIAWSLDERSQLVTLANQDPSCRCLVAVGGDGTVGALLNENPAVPLTVLPSGTENLFARHFGFSARPAALAETISKGRLHQIDLGLAENRRFALMAGIGFDAEIVTRHHEARLGPKGRLRTTSRIAYVWPVLRSSFTYRFPMLSATIEDPPTGESLSGAMVFLFNLRDYALRLPIAPDAAESDGLLDLVVLRDAGAISAFRYLLLTFCRRNRGVPGFEHRKVKRVRVTASEETPVQLDGDPGGRILAGDGSAWTGQVLPQACSLLVPRSYRPSGAS